MIRALAALAFAAGACFHPSYDAPRCGPDDECPAGFTCDRVSDVCQAAVPGDDAPAPDAAPFDGGPDGSLSVVPYLEPADAVPGTGDFTVSALMTINTTTPALTGGTLPAGVTLLHRTMLDGRTVAVLRVRELNVLAGLTVTGQHPLAIVADVVRVASTIDANAYLDRPGAGGAASGLGPNAGSAGNVNGADDSGGGGGGHGSSGERGGHVAAIAGGAGGDAITVEIPTTLRGGSGGGVAPRVCTNTGAGGAGGGALFIYAATSISVNGTIRAGGGGGRASVGCSSGTSGGSGGGAGGQIDLQSPVIGGTGWLAANGGGGAGGHGSAGPGAPGDDGGDGGAPGVVAVGGAGGAGAPAGTDGGEGAIGVTAAQHGVDGSGAGGNAGGGGGGVGVIVLRHRGGAPALETSPPARLTTF